MHMPQRSYHKHSCIFLICIMSSSSYFRMSIHSDMAFQDKCTTTDNYNIKELKIRLYQSTHNSSSSINTTKKQKQKQAQSPKSKSLPVSLEAWPRQPLPRPSATYIRSARHPHLSRGTIPLSGGSEKERSSCLFTSHPG